MRLTRLTRDCCLCLLLLLGADAPSLPPGAIGPMHKYHEAIRAADAERQKAIDRAATVLVSELKVAQKQALEQNRVDEATMIAELVKAKESENVTTGLDGSWTVHFRGYFFPSRYDEIIRSYIIHGDLVEIHELQGAMAGKSARGTLRDNICCFIPKEDSANGEVECTRFTRSGDELHVEIFRKTMKPGRIPDEIGVAIIDGN